MRHVTATPTAPICSGGWRARGGSSRRRSVSAEHAYDYAIIRVVPRVERGEMINVGVGLSCPHASFLEAGIELDEARLLALDDTLDIDAVRAHLATIPVICRGGADAGPIGALPQRNRCPWLVSPRVPIIQMPPVHPGRTPIPARALQPWPDPMGRRPQPARRRVDHDR